MINVLLYQVLAYTRHGNIWKQSSKTSKFKISAPTCNDEYELLDESYYVSDI